MTSGSGLYATKNGGLYTKCFKCCSITYKGSLWISLQIKSKSWWSSCNNACNSSSSDWNCYDWLVSLDEDSARLRLCPRFDLLTAIYGEVTASGYSTGSTVARSIRWEGNCCLRLSNFYYTSAWMSSCSTFVSSIINSIKSRGWALWLNKLLTWGK